MFEENTIKLTTMMKTDTLFTNTTGISYGLKDE